MHTVHIRAKDNLAGLIGTPASLSISETTDDAVPKHLPSSLSFKGILSKSEKGEDWYKFSFDVPGILLSEANYFLRSINIEDKAGNSKSISARHSVKSTSDRSAKNFVGYADMQRLNRLKILPNPYHRIEVQNNNPETLDNNPPIILAVELPEGETVTTDTIIPFRIKVSDAESAIDLSSLRLNFERVEKFADGYQKLFQVRLSILSKLIPEGDNCYSTLLKVPADLVHGQKAHLDYVRIDDIHGNSGTLHSDHEITRPYNSAGRANHGGSWGHELFSDRPTNIEVLTMQILRKGLPANILAEDLPSVKNIAQEEVNYKIEDVLPLPFFGNDNPNAISISKETLSGFYASKCVSYPRKSHSHRFFLQFSEDKLVYSKVEYEKIDCDPNQAQIISERFLEFNTDTEIWPQEKVRNLKVTREYQNSQYTVLTQDKVDRLNLKNCSNPRNNCIRDLLRIPKVSSKLADFTDGIQFAPIALRLEGERKKLIIHSEAMYDRGFGMHFRSADVDNATELYRLVSSTANLFIPIDYPQEGRGMHENLSLRDSNILREITREELEELQIPVHID